MNACAVAVSVACATARVERLLRGRLAAKQLSYRWVVCTREYAPRASDVRGAASTSSGAPSTRPHRRFPQSTFVFRCNVNFGDPHIVQYCAVVRGNRLVTDHEDARIRCGRKPDPAR